MSELDHGPVSSAVTLSRLTTVLGGGLFFVSYAYGTKEPRVIHVERPFEGTKSEAYRALFDGANIAVYLGKASGTVRD